MLRNYLVVAVRALRRQKGYAALNVAGLAVGLACCAVIGLYVREELSYDRWHRDADRVVRVESYWDDFSTGTTNWPLVQALRTDYPQVPAATILQAAGTVRRGDAFFREPHILFTDATFFEVFSYRLAQGNARTALATPYTVVLAPETARKYFGDADPIGQTLRIYGQTDVTVTGVLATPPGPSHLRPDFLVSWPTLDAAFNFSAGAGWSNNSVYTYLKLPASLHASTLEAALPALIGRHAGENWNDATLRLRPLADIHLRSHHNMELAPNGNAASVTLFGAIAGFILLLACVNFMNLATARSLERAREVGVRKSLGAPRGQLAGQFLAEAVVMAALGLVVAAGVVVAALPFFRTLADRSLLLTPAVIGSALAVAVVLTLVVGLLSGSYPAAVLSGFRPTEVLRGRFATSGRGTRLRKALVVFQFAVAVVLLVGTMVVYTQLRHLRGADLGFAVEQIVNVPAPETGPEAHRRFFEALRKHPEVVAATVSSEPLPSPLLNGMDVALPDASAPTDIVSTRLVTVGAGFFEALGVRLIAGRDFTSGNANDSAAVVLTESAAKAVVAKSAGRYTTPAQLVGESLTFGDSGRRTTVLGIAPDLHLASLQRTFEPASFWMQIVTPTNYLVRVRPGQGEATVTALRAAFAEAFPDALFEFSFADAAFDAAYRDEERMGRLFGVFAGLGVFVACLGLIGLAAYAAQQRRKEIGVRKVLGASVASVVALLSKDFAYLVLAAAALSAPVAYVGAERWLDTFAYRTALGPAPFLVAAGLAIGLALAAVSVQAVRAATAD
ncbi:MAG TPA: ABC transporter permease, partial [Rhodothermales bacterium]|nr:ABC transporter permease [Rhodothermales bacterium]